MNWLAESALAALVGAGSALVPLINAEAYAVLAATRTHPTLMVVVVVALATGQTTGKLIIFEASRRGSPRLHARFASRTEGAAVRWGVRLNRWLSRRRTGVPTVLASAVVGLPPLALVSLAAGASAQRRWEFAAACLVGRSARFAAIALPTAYAVG